MKHIHKLKTFLENRNTDIPTEYFSSHEYIICPYCQEEQNEYPYRIVKYGIVNYTCEYCDKKFQVEKEEIYHSSKIEIDRSDRER